MVPFPRFKEFGNTVTGLVRWTLRRNPYVFKKTGTTVLLSPVQQSLLLDGVDTTNFGFALPSPFLDTQTP